MSAECARADEASCAFSCSGGRPFWARSALTRQKAAAEAIAAWAEVGVTSTCLQSLVLVGLVGSPKPSCDVSWDAGAGCFTGSFGCGRRDALGGGFGFA